MNITFVIDGLGYGGAEKMIVLFAHGLSELGHNISIVNLNLRNDPIAQDVSRLAVSSFSGMRKVGILGNLSLIHFTYESTRKFNSNIIVGFKEMSNFCAVIVGKLQGVPTVICERADPYVSFKHCSISRKIKLFCINRARGAVFQTKEASLFYSHSLQSKCAVIPNPIVLNEQIPVRDKVLPHTVVSLGRFDNFQKRLDVMIEGFSLFHQYRNDYKLVIYGSGNDEALLKKLIQKYNLCDCVSLMGVSKHPIIDLCREGIFLITSDFEGISNSLLEAMAVGMPVVATDHSPGGARLLVKDHHNGLLVPTGDPNSVANALLEFADNPKLAERCGLNAREVLNLYTLSNAIKEWDNYLSHLVNHK